MKRNLTPRVRMTETEKRKMDELAWYYGINYSELIRRLILREYDENSRKIAIKFFETENPPDFFKEYEEE